MRILQGKSSLSLGNNPRQGGLFYQDSFLGPDRKVKTQDVFHTSEMAPDPFISTKSLSFSKAIQKARNLNTPKEDKHAWHSHILE